MSRTTTGRRVLTRGGALALAASAVLAVWAPAAGAAPRTTITLDPGSTTSALHSPLHTGEYQVVAPLNELGLTPVGVAWGGSVTFTLPPAFSVDGPSPGAVLELHGADDNSATRTYTSDSAVPADRLTVTDLGARRYQVDMPADDGSNGPFARLTLTGLGSAVPGVDYVAPQYFGHSGFELSGGGPATVDLPLQVIGRLGIPCDCDTAEPVATVHPGEAIDVVLPADGEIAALGVPDLTSSAFAVVDEGGVGPNGQWGTDVAAVLSADRRTATVTVPEDAIPGHNRLHVTIGNASASVIVRAYVHLSVSDRPANAGLASDTGWTGPVAGEDGPSALVPIGAGLVAVAGAVAVAAVRRRPGTRG